MNALETKIEKLKQSKEYRVLELNSKGLTVEEISISTGFKQINIRGILSKHKVKVNRYKNINESNELTQLILGSILGDGNLTKIQNGKIQSRLRISHCLEQEEYCRWKSEILKNNNLLASVGYSHTFDKRFKEPDYTVIKFSSLSHPIFSKYRNIFYNNNKNKSINIEEFKKLDNLGLAIWYMDDGTKTKSSMILCTNSFSKEELILMIDLLKIKFNLDFTLQKNNQLYLRANSWKHFKSLVEQYIVSCMKYKIRD